MALSEQQQQSLLGVTSFMFDFAPDQASYDRFESILDENPSFYDLGTNLAGTDAYTSQFSEGATADEKIGVILGRLGLEEGSQGYERGTDFINQRLDDGIPEGQVLMEIGEKLLQETPPEGLEDAAATLQNKIAVSQNYLESGAEGYSSDTIPDLLDGVTADQASVEAAQEKIDNLPTQSGGEGETFTLTGETDVLTGTDGDDTFLAPEDSFQQFDQIDGGAGVDTLRVAAGETVDGDISGVEVLSVEGDGDTTVNADSVGGLEQLSFVGNETGATVTGLTDNQTVSVQDAGTETLVEYDLSLAADASVVNVELQDSNVGVSVSEGEADSLNVRSSGTSTLNVVDTFAAGLSSVAVAASGALTLSGDSLGSNVEGDVTFDAAESEGNITADGVLADATNVIGGAGDDNFGALDTATSVEAGAGDDTIDLSGNEEDVTVNAGAGDDRIELGEQGLTGKSIDGGEGNDTVVTAADEFSTQNYDAINTLQNVETLEFSADDVTVDASELDASALTFTGNAATVENLGADQTAVVDGGAVAETGTAAEQTLNVEGDIADTVNVEASYDEGEDGTNLANIVTLNVADDEDVESAETLNLSGNGNVEFVNGAEAVEEATDDSGNVTTPGVPAGETFASVDASEMTGELDYTNVADVEESITLGEDNGADTLTVADGSTYGSMDVITNFDSTVDEDADGNISTEDGADTTFDTLEGITGEFASVDVSDANDLNGAFATAAADGAAGDGVFFNFDDNTYAFADSDGNGEYGNADAAIQLVGTHDLSADNAAYADVA